MKGTCSQYNRMNGWGFVISDDPDAPDFFVHCKSILGDKHQRFLRIGQRVEFDAIDVDTKLQAVNVRKFPTIIARQVSDKSVQS